MKTLFPYPTLAGSVELNLDDARVDGKGIADYVDTARQQIGLAGLKDGQWERARVWLTVSAPVAEVASRSDRWTELCAIVRLSCAETNTRQTFTLVADPGIEGRWTGSIELGRDQLSGRGTIEAVVTAKVDGQANRIIGTSNSWMLLFDDLPPSPVYGSLRMRWVDFSAPGRDQESFLRQFEGEPIYLALEETSPVLLLNRGFPGLQALLTDKPRRPSAVKAVYNVTRSDIAARVWHALFVASLEHGEVDELTRQPVWPTEDWMKAVLESLFARMYPNKSPHEALAEALGAQKSPDGAADLQTRLVVAVSGQAQVARLLRDSVSRLSDRPEGGEE